MKRRLLSAFLAVMMVLTMAPVAFAADGGEAVAQQGTSVSLPTDNKGNLTISDDGAVLDGTKETYTNGTITVNAANVTIKNLTFGDQAKLVVNTSGKFTLTGCTFAPETVCDKATKLPVRTAVTLNVSEAEVTNNTFEGVTNGYYNAIEFGFGASNNDLSKAVIRGNTFNSAIRNNYFSFYNMTANAQIDIVNNKLLLAAKNSNGIRISNYRNVKGVTFNVTDDEYTYADDSADDVYEGLILLQDFFKDTNVQNFSGITINVTKLSAPKSAKRLLYVYDDHTQSIITTNQPKLTGDDSLAQFYAAKVGNTYYKTLAEAVSAADNNTVTLLKDTVEDVVIPADKTITLNLNGKKLTNVASHTIFNNGTLTINGEGTVDNVTHGKAALVNYGTAMLNNGVTLKRSSEKGTLVPYNNGGNSYYTILNDKGATMTINNATVENSGGYSSAICNGGDPQCNKESYLTINDGNFSGGINTVKNDGLGILTINGGTFSNSSQYVVMNWHKAEFHGTATFSANAMAEAVLFTSSYDNSPIMAGELKVFDGYYKAATDKQALIRDYYDADNKGTAIISGGYFTTDPSAYVASGYVAGTSDVSGYSYKVVAKTNTGSVEVKPDVADPEVTVSGSISEEDKQKVENAAKTVSAPTLGAETGDIVKDINEDTAKTLIEKATTVQGNNKKLYVQSSLKVEPTAYDAANKTLALKITPQYRIVASTAATADDIQLGDNGNAQVVQDYTPMNITKATVVTMELPDGFASGVDKLSIQHTKSNGTVEYYTGTVTEQSGKHLLTFTTNGFSPFVISVPAASIGENVYPTLQAAADAAKSTDVISVKSGASHELNFTTTKSVKVKNETGADITVKFNGTDKGVAAGATETFTYTKPSSGGSSGGSSSGKTTYKVTTLAVNNGGVNASPSTAEKGAAITITLSPDKGYKLDKLTVTDGSGKTVSTVKKSDTVYTFTMPASAVKVGVSYVKATETPSETKFNDVSANDWFASAVDYVTGKGMMNGTADNTFSPKANTTRGMVVTVLYRLENQPSTSAASFTDVASGAYYANAVAWANANGIVSGYGSGKFGPNDKVTREQLAAILYRYAQYKKYDVSVGEDTNILSYDDAQSISSYAIPAIQWACGAGVVTGKSGSKLDPKGNATRAEVAAMLMRFCENVK